MPSKIYRSNEALGKLGESVLSKWAHGVGYVINGSLDDRAGWDGYMESPPEAASDAVGGFGHADTFPFRARIQVKTTDKTKGRVTGVAISNWLRLAEAPEPAFFLVLEMGGQEDPQSAYLVHVDKELIRSVLQWKRENEVGPKEKLHRIKRPVIYKKAPRVTPLSGRGLLAAIDAAIDPVAGDYVAWKRAVLLTAGFELGHAIAHVTLADEGSNPARVFAEMEVGLRSSVEFKNLDLYGSRFGLRSPSPELTVPGGLFKGGPPVPAANAKITLDVPQLEIKATAQAELFVPNAVAAAARTSGDPSVLSGLPIRVQAERVTLVSAIDAAAFTLSFSPPDNPDEHVSLRGLREMAQFASVARRAVDANVPVVVGVRTDSGVSFESDPTEGTVRGLEGDEVLAFADLVEATWTICRALDAEDEVRVSMRELVDQAPLILSIDAADRGMTTEEMSMTVTFLSEASAVGLDATPAGYLCGLCLGGHRVLTVVQLGPFVVDHRAGLVGTCRVPPNSPRVVYRHLSTLEEPTPNFEQIGGRVADRTGRGFILARHPQLIRDRSNTTEATVPGV